MIISCDKYVTAHIILFHLFYFKHYKSVSTAPRLNINLMRVGTFHDCLNLLSVAQKWFVIILKKIKTAVL